MRRARAIARAIVCVGARLAVAAGCGGSATTAATDGARPNGKQLTPIWKAYLGLR